ncbi:hypothetical protein KCP75_25725 [Salmonella enterica subsp. enterica]|nr:hypothetical protein KCP75_25725 [Salmonella enterica subsp. enterica]
MIAVRCAGWRRERLVRPTTSSVGPDKRSATGQNNYSTSVSIPVAKRRQFLNASEMAAEME